LNTAKPHEAHPLSLLQTIPGIGNILSLVGLYAMPQSDRVPRGQACASDGRLVTCRKASGGNRVGTSGTKIGHAPLTWAFSAAATLCLRNTPQGQKLLSRLEQKPAQGKALSLLAPTLGRAVSDRRKRHTAFAMDLCLRT
jgi:Transposase IS116/IS110/IS902 family